MKFQIDVRTDTYFRYVIEADSAEEALGQVEVNRDHALDDLVWDIEIESVPDDTPIGDN